MGTVATVQFVLPSDSPHVVQLGSASQSGSAAKLGRVAKLDSAAQSGRVAQSDLESAFTRFLARMHDDEELFSPFKPTSAISKLARGQVAEAQFPPRVKEVLKACQQAKTQTSGRFDAWWQGWFNPTGYVKGWSAQLAFAAELEPLTQSGAVTAVAVNVGGDIQVATAPGTDWTFTIGINDPLDRSRVIARLELAEGAVATSGSAERGDHIFDPTTGLPVTYFPEIFSQEITSTEAEETYRPTVHPPVPALGNSGRSENAVVISATVVADDLSVADLWATTAVVAGFDDLTWIAQSGTRSGLLVAADGRLRRWSNGIELTEQDQNFAPSNLAINLP
jgi:thiamine biosynthesis lipoprotein